MVEGNQRGENQVKRNEAEKRRSVLPEPWDPLALKSAQANLTLRAASKTLLKFKSNRLRLPCLGSSVEIDVNASSRVVRSEHLLEFFISAALRC